MIAEISENEFKSKLENSYPYYLYCIRWPSQPRYVKVGYGNKYRPCSSSYSTPFGSDGHIKIWIPEEDIDKSVMFSIEQQLHSFLKKRCSRGNRGGREVYKIEFDLASSYIEEFIIENQIGTLYKKFETMISTYKKNFKPKAEDYTVFAYNLLLNVNKSCVFCNRKCSNQIYECLCLNDNEKTEIYVGSTCFKKLNHTYLKNSTVTASNYKLNKILNPQFENEIEEEKIQPILNTAFITKDDVVDCYIEKIENNTRKEKSYIEKTHMNHIEAYLMNNICHYIFNNNYNKTFELIINHKFVEQYKLTNIINIITIYGLLCNSKYIILGPLDLQKNQFEIKFIHPKLNSTYITTYFSEYKNEFIFNYFQTNQQVQNLNSEQIKSLESNIPYISGFPGTGKSRICKYIIEQNSDKKILIITPTYSTRQSLAGEFENGEYTNILPVVIASIYDKKLIINQFNPDILLVDEYGMIDIIGWYKIMNICETFRPTLKVFGDPYQLPPIDFQAESQSIIKQLYTISNKLKFNFRSTNCPEQYNYLIENKLQYNIFDIQSKFEVVPYNNETILSLSEKEYSFLASTNKYVNKINQIRYDSLKADCAYCILTRTENQIHITNKQNITYTFCDKCINRYHFIFTSNINCIKWEQKDEIQLPNEPTDPQYAYKIYPKEGNQFCYYSKTREKIFYNGEQVEIRLGTKEFNRKYYVVKTWGSGKRVVVFDIESLFKNCINLAYAQTVHKSQGQTLQNVAIIMDTSRIMSSLLYTAFTRAKKLRSVKILFPEDIQISITRNEFEDECIKCIYCNSKCKLKITSPNSSNPNRKYWGCSNSQICGSGVIQWFDETKFELQIETDIEKHPNNGIDENKSELQLETEFENHPNNGNETKSIETDFDIENHPNKLNLRLKDGKDIVQYKNFFKINNIYEEPKGSKIWVIRTDITEKKQKLIEHIRNNVYPIEN